MWNKNFLIIAILLFFSLVGFGCSKDNLNQLTYINKEIGFQIDYPKDWRVGEYFSEDGSFSAVAFDPISVVSQEEYHTLDMAPGTVWFFLGSVPENIGSEMVEIGHGLLVQTFTDRYEENCPNAWWWHKTDRRYFIDDLTIVFAYPNDLENDVVFQKQLAEILGSFKISSR